MKLIYFICVFFGIHSMVYGLFEDGSFFNFGSSRNGRSNLSLGLCDENKLLLHLADLQILSPERIILQLSFVHPSDICKNLQNVIFIVNHEYRDCIPLPSDNLYKKLFDGLKRMNEHFCLKEKSNKKIKKHIPCFKELHEEFIDCEGPSDWFEDTNSTNLCQNYQEIMNCCYIKTAKLCGIEAAHLLRILSKGVFDATIQSKCKLPKEPKVLDAMPMFIEDENGSSNALFLNIYLISITFLITSIYCLKL